MIAPLAIRCALSASAPVNDRLMPTLSTLSSAQAEPSPAAVAASSAALNVERREIIEVPRKLHNTRASEARLPGQEQASCQVRSQASKDPRADTNSSTAASSEPKSASVSGSESAMNPRLGIV